MAAASESKIPIGQTLVGKYRVVREIGRGGMAAVYEAEQLSLGKKVAVKVLAAELSASTIVIERFFREARAAASVKSPYIVDVYDSGRLDDGRPFIAMELLEGESLYDRMARVRIIDVETTTRVIVHTAKGLMKAHGAGIVHRDLKPENIFLTKGEDGDDICKILDFGLAKFYAPVNPEEKAQKRLTREGAVFGTPAYMSPEQVKGQGNVDQRADLWALGCMAFECLIGRPVWNMDQGVAMTFASIATGPIPVPSQSRPDLPPSFDAWFKKCLERDPAMRYQTAKELSDAFVEAWGQRPTSASFPNVVLPKSGKYGAAQIPMGDAQELTADTIEQARLPQAAPSARQVGSVPGTNGEARTAAVSSGSEPLSLVKRGSDAGPPSFEPTPLPQSVPSASPARLAVSAVFLAASLSMAIFVWVRFLHPQVFTAVTQSTASAVPSASPSGSGPSLPLDEPKWVPVVAEGQRLFASNPADAMKKFQDAIALGGGGAVVGRVMAEQLKVASSKEISGQCKPVGFSRPRLAWDRRAERPAIITMPKGALVTWTDDHDIKDKDHVYGVLIDKTGRSIGPIRDLTPEAADAQRPQLVAPSTGSDRSVLLWWDGKGSEAGVHTRFLDGEGRIDPMHGQSVLVGAARPGEYWPSIERSRDGYLVVWQDDRDHKDDFDLFVRRLSNDLQTQGPETRLTDYNAPPKTKPGPPRVKVPSVAVAPSTMLVAYKLEEPRKHVIQRMRVALDDLEKTNPGLPESKDPNRSSRELGDVGRISDDKLPADAPDIACGKEGCFVVWAGEPGGAWAAMIDPSAGNTVWRNNFTTKGTHPSLAVNEGQVAVAYYEGNRIKMVYLTRDGVGQASTLLKMNDGERPRPSLAAGGDPSEWSLAWQDSDAPRGAPEIYAARVVCR